MVASNVFGFPYTVSDRVYSLFMASSVVWLAFVFCDAWHLSEELSVIRTASTDVWLQAHDGWSDIPYDQQALHLSDRSEQTTFADYALGQRIRECPSLAHVTSMLETLPTPLSPMNVSWALEKLAVLGSSPLFEDQQSVCSATLHTLVRSICAGVVNAGEAELEVTVAARSLWALAEMASRPSEAGGPLVRKDDEVVQVQGTCLACP
jgi:hypothetical protein